MNVFFPYECLRECEVSGKDREDTQLDLRIVCDDEDISWTREKT